VAYTTVVLSYGRDFPWLTVDECIWVQPLNPSVAWPLVVTLQIAEKAELIQP